MNQRLDRRSRLHVAKKCLIGQGRAHGRDGWATMRNVAHAMHLRPGCYVMGLLHELVVNGVVERRDGVAPNGEKRYEFKMTQFGLERLS